MFRKLIILFLFLLPAMGVVFAQEVGEPASDGIDNYCFTEEWAGRCDADDPFVTDWNWRAGYYLYQYDQGNISYDQVPEDFRHLIYASRSGGNQCVIFYISNTLTIKAASVECSDFWKIFDYKPGPFGYNVGGVCSEIPDFLDCKD